MRYFGVAAGCLALVLGLVALAAPGGTEEKNMAQEKFGTATFAGGCFWCVEAEFRKLPGVVKVVSGYAGGQGADPTYEDYASKGHVEAVQILFDPRKISYGELVEHFWRQVDPTDPGGQFADRGRHYRTVIFYHDEEQRQVAEASKAALAASGRFRRPIVTEILPFTTFYPAEEYHQDFARKNPGRYCTYRSLSGREQFLKEHWGSDPQP